jgi:transmembrane sensor
MELHPEIEDLIIDYLSGNIDETGQEKLDYWIDSDPENKEWFEKLKSSSSVLSDALELDQLRDSRYWNELQHTVRHKRRRLFIRKLERVAAVFIVLLGMISVFYVLNKTPRISSSKNEIVLNKILPGGSKAILALADGRIITLDTAQNGKLADQGNTQILKLKSGQLIYQSSQATALRNSNTYNVLTIPRGGEYQLTLPDGTKVWLNSDTKLKFPVAFANDKREVWLEGEAYFEVSKNPSRPFIVRVKDKEEVKVLGTHFNIMSYADEPEIKTTLVEGSVRITFSGHSCVTLEPGQQSRLTNEGVINVADVNTSAFTAWKDGLFLFYYEDMGSIMRKLSRWYNVNIAFETPEAQNVVFYGKLKRYDTIDKLLEMIKLTNKVDYSIKGNTILIRKV